MSNKEGSSKVGCVSICVAVLQALLLFGKISGMVDRSWWIVMSPTLFYACILIVLLIIVGVITVIIDK